MSDNNEPVEATPVSAGGVLVGAGVIGAAVGVIMWFAEREERRPNYASTIVVLVISGVVLLFGVILLAGRSASGVPRPAPDGRSMVERMIEHNQRDD